MTDRGLMIAAALVVGVAVVAGVYVLPSPGEERTRRADERRVEDLRAIARATDLYWTRHGALPGALADLERNPGLEIRSSDAEAGRDYEFRVVAPDTYELCAAFDRTSATFAEPGKVPRDASEVFWSHDAGRWCYTLEAREVPAREELPSSRARGAA